MRSSTPITTNAVITLSGEGIEQRPAGAPRTVAGVFLFLLMKERRAQVEVEARGGRIRVLDFASGEAIAYRGEEQFGICNLEFTADPGRFTTSSEIDDFFDGLREATGSRRLVRRFRCAASFCPPRTLVIVRRYDLGPSHMKLAMEYDVSRWRWHVCYALGKLRSRCWRAWG